MDIRPITGAKSHTDLAADLRALADLVERDPFISATVERALDNNLWPAHAAGYEHADQRRELMAEAIRRFQSIATGPIAKRYDGDYFRATVPMRAISLTLVDIRESVCTRVVTGTEVVTEEIPDPAYIAAAPTITQAREIETVEWQCHPLLAATSRESEA